MFKVEQHFNRSGAGKTSEAQTDFLTRAYLPKAKVYIVMLVVSDDHS